MKVGLLGAGRIGKFHARVLAGHPDVETLVIGDVDPEAPSTRVRSARKR
jgi:myo-inositol 2-dehydrogenase / D-chiro-inositol 1-dehydrogenase